MYIFKEQASVISKESVWVCINRGYLYAEDTLFALLCTVIDEWKHDSHLVG